MKKNVLTKNLDYRKPTVETLEVSVEKGFAASGPFNNPSFGWGDDYEA